MSGRFEWLRTSPERIQQVIEEISYGSEPRVSFYVLLTTAALIASVGLIANSNALLIGAMLVCPLMTPMLGIALALVLGDAQLLGRAVRTEALGVTLAMGMASVLGLFPLALEVNPLMLSTAQPNLLDLLVAVLAGFAGTYAFIDARISPALPGVAIATSIMPPLTNTGLCLAVGAYAGAWGSFLLFAANFLAILLVAAATFVAAGMAPRISWANKWELLRSFGVAGVGFIVVTALLTQALVRIVQDRYLSNSIKTVIAAEFSQFPSTSLVNAIHQFHQGKLYILATVRTPKVIAPDRVRTIQDSLNQQLSRPTELIVRTELAKDVSATGSTSQVAARNLDGFFLTAKMPAEVVKVQLAEQALREVLAPRPELYLMDVDLRQFPRGPVILATLQGSRVLIPAEVQEFERAVQARLQDPQIRLLVRCLPSMDVDSQGRILYGEAHLGSQDPLELARQQQVAEALREEFRKFSDIFLTNVDAVLKDDQWSVRVEAVGARPISGKEVATLEKAVSRRVNKPVKIHLWFRREVMVTDAGYTSMDEFIRQRLKEKPQDRREESPVSTVPRAPEASRRQ